MRISGVKKCCDIQSVSSRCYAEVAHLVEHDLAKVGVAGSSPVFRSGSPMMGDFFWNIALVVKLVDTQDLKSCGQQCLCGFNSRLGHKAIW
jgi:hypothetical protein